MTFDPNQHLMTITRKQRQPDGSYKQVDNSYMQVAWRIVWFRTEHPTGSIVTDLLSTPGQSPAVVRATVSFKDEDGETVTATGFGQQGTDDWSDWLEKAETRAIGRALGVLGYGTQFASGEFEDVIADSPVNGKSDNQPPAPRPQAPQQSSRTADTGEVATENQVRAMFAIGKKIGMGQGEMSLRDELHAYGQEIVGRDVDHIDGFTKAEASTIITALQEFQE